MSTGRAAAPQATAGRAGPPPPATWHRGACLSPARPPSLRPGQRRRLTSGGTGRFSAAAFSSSTESVWRSLSGAAGCGRRSHRLRRSRSSLPAGSAGGGSAMLGQRRPGGPGRGERGGTERNAGEHGGASGGGTARAAPRRVAAASLVGRRSASARSGSGESGGWLG